MYESNRLGGNIVSDGNGATIFTYQTEDTKAEVTTAGYFSQDRDPEIESPANTSYLYFNPRDIILAQCSDGFVVLMVVSYNTPTVVTETKEEEA